MSGSDAKVQAPTSPATTILVTGATGNVGREVVRSLLERAAHVRIGSRWGPRPSEIVQGTTRPEAVDFDFERPEQTAAALRGVRALFLMRPNPVLAVKKTLNRIVDIAVDQGVEQCVFLSVAGAERNSMVPHYAVEQHLMRSRMQWTMLRAGFFAQNLTGPYLRDIREGKLVLPARHAKVAYVDARDLGEVAAMALLTPERHAGQGYHLTGPDCLSFDEVAALLAASLGRPITYQATGVCRYWLRCRRRGLGFLPSTAYTVIHAALRNGSGAATDPTLSRLLGRPGRSLKQFITDHRSVLQ